MTFFDSIILGVVQGLTEFLPVSSSGHLVVAQALLGVADHNVLFEVVLHFATVLAILIFFRRRIYRLQAQEIALLGVASVPASLVGFFFNEAIVDSYSNVPLAASLLLVSGAINLLISKNLKQLSLEEKPEEVQAIKMTYRSALIIGLYQMVALAPGITRSGSTVLGGLRQGLSRLKAFEFSFLMAIPVILGANINELRKLATFDLAAMDRLIFGLGFIFAFAVGLGSLWFLKIMIERAKFEYFAVYCWLAGVSLLVLYFAGTI